MDDDSDDATASIVENYARKVGSTRIRIVRRELPNARTGKVHALNDAWFRVKDSLLTWNVDFKKLWLCGNRC
ncbi:MAG: hypothetical protein LBP35_04570 [Candidatus Ancillula trichonymphae]|nr:hypothetical protein [Candidatus Ancillula trichonymphae]